MFCSNAKQKFSKTFYVKNKRLAHLKRAFCVQKFGVEMHWSVKELRRVRGCVNSPHSLVHDYPVERH